MSVKYVLIAEDNTTLANLYAKLLKQAGCAVHFAANAEDAYTMFHKRRYDVFLCDTRINDGRGIDLLRTMRDILTYDNTGVIVISTNDAQDFLACHQMGIRFMMTRPAAVRYLADMVNELIATMHQGAAV
jgi:DNA-binding response OmpR family regulator